MPLLQLLLHEHNREMDATRSGRFSMLWTFRKSTIIVMTPLLLLPLPMIYQTKVANCAYMICLMAVYWVTEACPLAVTSLLPVVLCPLLGLQEANAVTMNYTKHTNFLIIGTLIMCIAIEESGLHRRVALKVLMWFGSQPCWILLGLMVISGFLSMWLMNLSTVSLMLPITLAVCNELKTLQRAKVTQRAENECERVSEEVAINSQNECDTCLQSDIEKAEKIAKGKDNVEIPDQNIEKAMLLGICYSSTIGGVCTVIGTPTNLIALGIYEDGYESNNVNFLTWLCFCLPLSISGLFITWVWIQIRFLRIREMVNYKRGDPSKKRVGELIKKLYDDLPVMSFAEKAVGVHFLFLVALWMFRDPRVFPGWSSLFVGGYARDSTTAILVGLSIYLFPSKSSSFSWIWCKTDAEVKPAPSLLEWSTFQKKFPWDIFILMGSGFAIAGACVDSGLSAGIGYLLVGLDAAPGWVIILAMSVITSIATEFTSNVATVGIVLPILLPMAEHVGISDVEVLLAVTLSASFAFTLPIATPTNAIIFSTGSVSIPDMLWTGIPLNFVFVFLLNIMIHLTGPSIFSIKDGLIALDLSNVTMSPTEYTPLNVTNSA